MSYIKRKVCKIIETIKCMYTYKNNSIIMLSCNETIVIFDLFYNFTNFLIDILPYVFHLCFYI